MKNNKFEILRMLEEDTFPVFYSYKTSINTNNGVLNKDFVKLNKQKTIKDAIKIYTNELVDVKQSYPEQDISDVQLTVDHVIIKRKDFDDLIKYIEHITMNK